ALGESSLRGATVTEPCPSTLDFSRVPTTGFAAHDVAHLSTYLLIVVSREGGAGQGHRALDGPPEYRHHLECVPQLLDGLVRDAGERGGKELSTIGHGREAKGAVTH